MRKPKKAKIQNAEQALAFLDYQVAFAKRETAASLGEIASVIRDLVSQGREQDSGDEEGEWVYVGSPRDVVRALKDLAWQDDVSDDVRIVVELGANSLEESLDRNVKLAQVIERTEAGL
jgi:alkanesulfonate monooxygenase SsuD/methylene tetrahydromethanopterin reductase-like flavin-dependent oxidoreductase (luciferase family)